MPWASDRAFDVEWIFAPCCSCRRGEPMHGGAAPLYAEREDEALELLRDCAGRMYWALHLRGRHVLDARVGGRLVVHRAGWAQWLPD